MNWLSSHWAHIVGGGSAGVGGAAFLGVMFRDSIRQIIEDWRETRRAARIERAAAGGKGERAWVELVALLKEDIKAQRDRDARMEALLGQLVTANERSLDVQKTIGVQIQDFDKRLGRVEGRLRIQ